MNRKTQPSVIRKLRSKKKVADVGIVLVNHNFTRQCLLCNYYISTLLNEFWRFYLTHIILLSEFKGSSAFTSVQWGLEMLCNFVKIPQEIESG